MTTGALPAPPIEPRRSAFWSLVFRVFTATIRLVHPIPEWWVAHRLPGLRQTVTVRTVGRKTGIPRRTLVTLLPVNGHDYVGHPSAATAWTRNLEAAGWADVDPPGARYTASLLRPGPERDALIRATSRLQPFPSNLLYRFALRHIAATGVYLRLDPQPSPDRSTGPM